MLRIIVRTDDATMAANVSNASVEVWHTTFLVDAPEVEAFLRAKLPATAHRQIVGYEMIAAAPTQSQPGEAE